ncbi:polyphosphate kinase 1 [Nonlabens sp. SY33080]|uniref:polyphosphate kinase 1 n=1 Tax=Nonlabens sp. SY33080 TaxID=2719911 RepID=UPI00142892C9|nr:polyphosphate kinase 1 [Nonlabens sp. SY33080]
MKYDFPYRHRDLNWLSFNHRVLQEAANDHLPVYERIKFMAIFSSNLDEFFRVRISQLRQLKKVRKKYRKKLETKPTKLVKEILAKVQEQQHFLGTIFHESIKPELEDYGIYLHDEISLKNDHKLLADKWFKEHYEDNLDISYINAGTQSNIFLENQRLYLLVTFNDKDKYGLVKIPKDSGRFITLVKDNHHAHIAFIDDIIKLQLDRFFSNEITGYYSIKLSRDAELYVEDFAEGTLAEKIYKSLEQRNIGEPTRLLYDDSIPDKVIKNVRKSLDLSKIDLVKGGIYHNFDDFFSFPKPFDNPDLYLEPKKEIEHKEFESNEDYFALIDKQDQLIHTPFMSFDYVSNLVNQAANDNTTEFIKISLYRVADDSKLVQALLEAVENEIEVVVFVEAKARFDEKNNIKWGQILEEKGARVIWSFPNIKVHSKALLIQKRIDGEKKRYAYIGTGNFNSKTAKVYCDHGLFTSHKPITKDLYQVFKVLEGDLIIPKPKHLLVSPYNTRQTFEDLIRAEIDEAQLGKPAAIWAKMNQLEDPRIIELLYKASQAGVTITLLVRGFSCLIPGLKNLSENISCYSIVDTYLEHGRIYKFNNAGNPKIFIGSADWMTRNLDRRIEVLVPIYDERIYEELNTILTLQLNDTDKARIHDQSESNNFRKSEKQDVVNSQTEIREYLKKLHS